MKTKIQQKTISFLDKIHQWLFQQPLSKEMLSFINNLSWSFFGGIISAAIIFIVNIIAGRILGPDQYGQYSLVMALSAIFVILMTWGLDTAIVFYVARNNISTVKKQYRGNVLLLYGILSFSVVIFLYLIKTKLILWFKAPSIVIYWAIIFALFYSLKNIADAFIKSAHQFRFQSFLRILAAIVILLTFGLFVFFTNFNNFSNYLTVILFGGLVFVLATFIYFRKKIIFSWKYTQPLLSYGSFAIVGAFSGILLNSFDKILINQYLGSYQLGIYNAYFTVSVALITQLIAMFINVFFPVLSSLSNKEVIFYKINKVFFILFLPLFIIISLIISLAISLFGQQYPFDFYLILEFSFLSTLIIYFTILWWLVASQGKKGIKFTSINGIIAGLLFIVLNILFSQHLNLHLVVFFFAMSIGYAILVGIVGYKFSWWKLK